LSTTLAENPLLVTNTLRLHPVDPVDRQPYMTSASGLGAASFALKIRHFT